MLSRSTAFKLSAVQGLIWLVLLSSGCGDTSTPQETAGRSTADSQAEVERTQNRRENSVDEPGADQPAGQTPPASPDSQTAAAPQGNWPGFRGPTGMGLGTGEELPTQWSESAGIDWKTPLPGAGASSPIVYGDRIYVTCYTGFFVPGESDGSPEKLARHLMAIDRQQGNIVWTKEFPARLPEESEIRDHGFAASTPVADDSAVYAFFGKSGVLAVSHSGELLWQTTVGEKTHGWGSAASPVRYGDLLFVNASVESESLLALDHRTGQVVWRAEGIRESWNTPVVITAESGRPELVLARQGAVLAFDPPTGEVLWTCQTDIGWYMVPSVVAGEGVVYCLGGRSGVAALAVRAGGTGDVTSTHRLWTSTKGANVPSPVYRDGHLYWASEQGIANCANAATGEIVYQERLERSDVIYASALLADGKLYYLARNGRAFVVAAKPQFELLSINDLRDGGVFNATPALDHNRLLIRSDKFLYRIGK